MVGAFFIDIVNALVIAAPDAANVCRVDKV